MANAWWVNQGQSPADSYATVWSPLRGEGDRTVPHWDAMEGAAKGDVIIHYARQAVRGISLAEGPSIAAPRPYTGDHWNNAGRVLPVLFAEIAEPLRLDDLPIEVRTINAEQGPFTRTGSIKQGYFFPLAPEAAEQIAALAGIELKPVLGAAREWSIDGQTDREGIVKLRREQPKLRRWLLSRQSNPMCELCGQATPEQYLVAAHIKARSKCSEAERRDFAVAMLACLFGCDAAFESGDLVVEESGLIRLNAIDSVVRDRLRSLDRTVAPGFSADRSDYFRFHREWHDALRPTLAN